MVNLPLNGGTALDRRGFLKTATAALTWVGVGAGCSYQPREDLVPYVREPAEFVPGKSNYYATASPDRRIGLLVEAQAGRPIKIEGNPDHPGSLGHTDVQSQASILDLYDPDRSKVVRERGDPASWSDFLGALQGRLRAQRAVKGRGVRILTEPVTSPTLLRQLGTILAELPDARWTTFDPLAGAAQEAAARMFGRIVESRFHFDRALRVLSIGANFLSAKGGAHLRYAHDYMVARTPVEERVSGIDDRIAGDDIVRLYVLESTPTVTGAKADHVLRVPPSALLAATCAVAGALGLGQQTAEGSMRTWAEAVATDLQAHRGRSIVIIGEHAPADVHMLGHAMNAALGAIGETVDYIAPTENQGPRRWPIADLVEEMRSGSVEVLAIIGANPVYSAYSDLGFAEALARVPFSTHLGLYVDETAERCHWHVPQTHFLEAWSDVRAFDGTVSIVQPLIYPLYNGRSAHELLDALRETPEGDTYRMVRRTFDQFVPTGDAAATTAEGSDAAERRRAIQGVVDAAWEKALRDGVVAGTAHEALAAVPRVEGLHSVRKGLRGGPDSVDVVFAPDPNIVDGRYANNAWLQELPKELTTLTWENAIIIDPQTAARLGLSMDPVYAGGGFETDLVSLRLHGRSVEGPVWILPGQPEATVTFHLGYGRTRAGRVGSGIGVDAGRLRTSWTPWHGSGAQVARTGRRAVLASSQLHFHDEQREPVRLVRFDALEAGAPESVARGAGEHHPSFYPEYAYPLYRWGMAIDNNACTGCNACVIACQSENNVPVVGKEQVLRSREMHWLRIDTYYQAAPGEAAGGPLFQPLMCVHCEKAPCEPPCPVHATVHDADGLNVMIYNRCIGTRYCSNNCPYKVRRFNFLLYQDWETEQLKMVRNPDVTVRSRGVMEKCTYCTQRIQAAKIEASKERRRVRDGEIVTACQAVCPTNAIIFGDLNDPDAAVTRLRSRTRRASPLLGELNTQPRTHHLAVISHPNRALSAGGDADPTPAPSGGARE